MRRPRLLRWFPAEWQLGPLLRLETVRLARCTRVHWLRVGYSVALLAALALAYWRSFPTLSAGEILTGAGGVLALNDQAAFAERFVDSLFLVQFLAIILLTPIYCGSAITEERERGSLDLLLSAPLADGEILIFKMLSRTLLLIGLLIGTVPFIAVVFALGGVSWSSILWRLTGNAAVLLCLALLAVMMSARGRRTLTTVYLVYASILPFGMQIYLVADQDPTYLFLLLFIGFVYFLPYLRGAAHERQSFEPLPVDPSGNWWKKERGTAPVGEAALWWKEMHWIAAPQHHPVFWGMATLAYVIPLLLGLLIFLPGVAEGRSFQVAGVSYRWFAILWAIAFAGYATARAVVSVAGERERQTLDALLLAPMTRPEILGVKWLAGVAHAWILAAFAGGSVLLGVATFAIHPLGAIYLAVVFAVHVLFWTSLGMLLSVWCATVLAAAVRMAYAVLAVVGGTLCCFWWFSWEAAFERFVTVGLNPLLAWSRAGFTWHEWRNDPSLTTDLRLIGWGSLLHGSLALGCLTATVWSFYRQQTGRRRTATRA